MPTRSPRSRGDKSVENWLAPSLPTVKPASAARRTDVYELQKAMIAAGVAGSHRVDQLASEKKCGHLGGKGAHPDPAAHPFDFGSPGGGRREYPDGRHRTHRRRGDVAPPMSTTVTSRFVAGERTAEVLSRQERPGPTIARARPTPVLGSDLDGDQYPRISSWRRSSPRASERIPGPDAVTNCSPSFAGSSTWTTRRSAKFQKELGAMGFKFQFITLAGQPSTSMFDLAYGCNQMSAYVELQEREVRRRGAGLHRH